MLRIIALLIVSFPLAAAEPSAELRQALEQFQRGAQTPEQYRQAAAHFASAAAAEPLTAEQQAAWAYCRVRGAAEEWNASRGDAAVARRVIAEITAALALAPDYAALQKFGGEVIVSAGGTLPTIEKAVPKSGWFSLETANFRVRFREPFHGQAEALAKAAEEQRVAVFTRWSGPPQGAWAVKCEIVVHATAAEFAAATQQPATATGHALVQLNAGKPSLRRLDLRADDETAVLDALPRELTHIVLADLFPTTAPPRWAADGMAVLAMSPTTVERFVKTAAGLLAKNELPTAATLLGGSHDAGAAAIIGRAALVEYLVRLKGERSLTVFLRDAQRYGVEKSLERQFQFGSVQALDAAWHRELAK